MNSEIWMSVFVVAGVIASTWGLYWVCNRFMRPFHNRAFICLLAVIVGGYVCYGASRRYIDGQGGYKLGVDLIGGTILVYEVDAEKFKDTAGDDALSKLEPAKMVEFLKRRIDPNDLYNVTIRPVGGNTRYEIILPTGGAQQAIKKQEAWNDLLTAVKGNPNWKTALVGIDLEVDRDREGDLGFRIRSGLDKQKWSAAIDKFKEQFAEKLKDKPVTWDVVTPGNIVALAEAVKDTGISADEVKKAIESNYKPTAEKDIKDFIVANYRFASGGQRKDFSAEMVEETKSLITKQGSLEFRIAANDNDDAPGIASARAFVEDAKNKSELETRARRGFAPPPVAAVESDPNKHSYTWVELERTERQSLGLSNRAAGSALWNELSKARADGKIVVHKSPISDSKKGRSGQGSFVFYSRPCTSEKLTEEERAKKQIEYFMLLRDPGKDERDRSKAVTGERLRQADVDDFSQSVTFSFDAEGGRLFGELTGANAPTGPADSQLIFRHLAIVLDGGIVSAPFLSSRIDNQGQIQMGNSPREERTRLVKILRSGALPAPIKPTPVSENTIGPTLGADTITKGLWSVGIAFAAVMAFMVFYYRFAGIVACTALMVNLLLTIAFMVFVNATFTLPGLAGLVLMLGMAVDANVLIYERIREERERGASLSLAVRNGYDRAFPTIIDTHVTSFFTAIVLYAVGNDQLRGFGISLAAGLVISLFTSLYMTRLMFDVWQYKGWLKQLSMLKLFTRTSIDFMRIRYYWFTATVILTVVGLAVFLIRGSNGLNIDFVGGTAYGGQLKEGEGRTIGELRELLQKQESRLAIDKVEQLDEAGKMFRLTYKSFNERQPQVEFVNAVPGSNRQEREDAVKLQASKLPDWSVDQTFVAKDIETKAGASRYFTVRTTEKDADLVQVSVDRLLAVDKDGKLESLLKSIALNSYEVKGKQVALEFSDYASPGYLKLFLSREFKLGGLEDQGFDLRGEGKAEESRYKNMTLEITTSAFDPSRDRAKLDNILKQTKDDFAARPQPERLEKFDAQLAAETSARAAYAVLASWAVILLFLWFRFGNWTFGLAAVLCLVHDLAFTLGAIAGCHYLVRYAPGVASFLLIDDFKIDLPAIAAMLTLISFSVNDTIVVFDRIREVRGKNPLLTEQIINDSVNQTLSRTILASTTVFLVVGVLYLFGGESIRLFAFVMVIGVIVGTYSSIYIASPLLLMFGEGKEKKNFRSAAPATAALTQ